MVTLFDEVTIGRLRLPSRIVMAPMGRGRSTADGAPLPIVAQYYAQRATAGLIISEATNLSPVAVGHPFSVQWHTPEHGRAWRRVAGAVHDAGGRMVLQIMHSGRISHPALHGRTPLAPSPVRPAGVARTSEGPQEFPVPRQMSAQDMAETVADFVRCAREALDAGFDGVELHGANGYLLHQFLSGETNRRDDGYGGAPAGRVRFVADLVAAVAAEVGADRVGIRLSPGFGLNDMREPDAADVYPVLLAELARIAPAYLHFVAGSDDTLVRSLRTRWPGRVIYNIGTGNLDVATTVAAAEEAVDAGFDAISFGKQFLANPDLPFRLAHRVTLNRPDPVTFYQGGSQGYIDYPTSDLTKGTEVAWSSSSTS